jgi:hypothetical protein
MCIITGISVYAALQESKAQSAAYEYQAQVAQQNAKIAENNAAMERQAGLEEARRTRIKSLQEIGQQKVGMAAGGVDVATGTPLDALEDTATMGELDALMLQYDAEKRAVNYEIEAKNFLNQSSLDLFSARNAKTAGYIKATEIVVRDIANAAGAAGGGFGSSSTSLGTSRYNSNKL